MKKKKILALLLAALLTSAALVSCGEGEAETQDTTVADTTNVEANTPETEGETTRAQIKDNLPDKDFGGKDFHLLTRALF